MLKRVTAIALILTLSACAGVRTNDKTYTSHAESINVMFLQIPGGDTQKRAMELIPAGGEVVTIISPQPRDTSSFWGVMNRLLGFDVTIVSGIIK